MNARSIAKSFGLTTLLAASACTLKVQPPVRISNQDGIANGTIVLQQQILGYTSFTRVAGRDSTFYSAKGPSEDISCLYRFLPDGHMHTTSRDKPSEIVIRNWLPPSVFDIVPASIDAPTPSALECAAISRVADSLNIYR